MTIERNRTALVTGASRGLGRALALALAERGYTVYGSGRGAESLNQVAAAAADLAGRFLPIVSDQSSDEDNARVETRLVADDATLDLLVHNASLLGPRVPLAEYPLACFRKVVEVNLVGVFELTRRLIPRLNPGASLQLVTSGVGIVGKARWGAYSASKFGVEALGQILAEELRARQIRVNVVDPGSMRTSMRAEAFPDEDPLTLTTPEDNLEVFLWLAEQAPFETTGQRFKAKDPVPPV